MCLSLKSNVHRVLSENPDADAAAKAYEETIVEVTQASLPRLDLILLGLGTDGHTASIFPGSEVLHETERLVAAPWVEKLNAYRITMTLPLLNNGASVVFLVSGAEKAEIVKDVFQGPPKRIRRRKSGQPRASCCGCWIKTPQVNSTSLHQRTYSRERDSRRQILP